MAEAGCQDGDFIQAVPVEIYGVDNPTIVWVVVTQSGLVLKVAEPPVGGVLPVRPSPVDLPAQTP